MVTNTGKVFVVTGAAGGIGRDLVRTLLAQKAVVWALDRSETGLASLSEEASRQGFELHCAAVDLTEKDALGKVFDSIVTKHGRIHVWVNGAGIAGKGDFGTQSATDFERVMSVNFGAVVAATRLAVLHFEQKGGGAVVNIGSVAGFVPAPYLAAYSASKHAVVGFTRALREELRLKHSSTRAILVSPGFVDTDMLGKDAQTLGFPPWLEWALSPPAVVTQAILQALRTRQDEVMPTWNGRVMAGLHTLFPGTTRRRADLLLARSLRDWVLNRYTVG